MVALMHSLKGSELTFVPSVHEATAVSMADGYARIKGTTGVLLYMLPGISNGLGNLYNAWRDETPILVVASQQTNAARTHEGTVGEGDTASLVQPFMRHSWEVRHRGQLGSSLVTALGRIQGPPSGPGFMAIPEDVLTTTDPVFDIGVRRQQRLAPPGNLAEIQRHLLTAARPVVVVGGQVRRSGAVTLLESLVDDLEIPVFVEPFWNDRLGISPSHRSYMGPFTERSRMVREADLVLAIGCRLFNEVHPLRDQWFDPNAFVVHVNADPLKLEGTQRVDYLSASDPELFLKALVKGIVREALDASLREQRSNRLKAARERRSSRDSNPIGVAAAAVAETLDSAWIVDESVTGNFPLTSALRGRRGEHFLSTTGGSLGWGPGAAAGVAMATKEKVICFLGDGAFFFGLQGLWPTAAQQLPITYVVLDNSGFGSTRWFEQQYLQRHGVADTAGNVGSDFRGMGSAVESVASGFGIPSKRLSEASELQAALTSRLQGDSLGPALYVVPIPFE